MKKINIIYLIFNTKNNGGNKVVFEHINRLAKLGYKVEIFTLFGKQPQWFDLKIKIKNITKIIFQRKKPDVLVATFWPTAYLAYLIKAEKKFYFVQGWEEDFYLNGLLQLSVRLTLYLPLQIITVSDFLETRIKSINKNTVIHRITECGIDTSIFKPEKPDGKNINNQINILSVLSWYKPYKRPDLLAESISKLKQIHPNYKFTLASNERGPYSHVFDRFVHSPPPKEMAKLYQNADILLMMSKSEGFSIPGVEAMACKCLVITTDSGGVREYAKHNINAVILKNPEQVWKEDIPDRYLSNKKIKTRLIDNAYETAQLYNWDKIMERLEAIYKNGLTD